MDPRSIITHPDPDVLGDPGSSPAAGRSRGRRIGAIVGAALIVIGAGAVVRVPLHSVGPGPARDVLDLIKVEGATTYPSRGKMLLTTASVSGQPLTLWELLYVWVDPSLATAERHRIVQPGFDDEEQTAQNFLDMEQSKLFAELAAFEALGQPAVRIRGARVMSVIEGGPADDKLEEGDVIVAVDGDDAATPEIVGRLIGRASVGDPVTFAVRRGSTERSVEVTTGPSRDDPAHPVVGIFLGEAWRLPHDIEIDTAQIGGPSGGLVFALSIVDALTPGDLTGGHIIAATGTIERGEDGVARVGTIGAVPEKVRAARAVGATVFMLPEDEAAFAERLAPEGMTVIGVGTLGDAIAALEALPQHPAG